MSIDGDKAVRLEKLGAQVHFSSRGMTMTENAPGSFSGSGIVHVARLTARDGGGVLAEGTGPTDTEALQAALRSIGG